MSLLGFASDVVRTVGGAARDTYQGVKGAVESVASGAAHVASDVVTTVADAAVHVAAAVPAVAEVIVDQIRDREEVVADVIELAKDMVTPGADAPEATHAHAIAGVRLGGTPAEATTALRAGQPATLSVTVEVLRGNSEVSRALGRVHVGDSDEAAVPQRATGRIEQTGEERKGFAVEVDLPRRPTNLTLALEGGETIWRGAGTLEQQRYDVPDFAAALNAWLDAAAPAPGRAVTLRLVARSDTPGKIGFEVPLLDQYLLQAQRWPGAEGTPSPELVRDVDYGETLRLELDAIADAGAWREAVTMQASGTVGPDRVLGAVGDGPVTELATVSGEYFVAQRVQVAAPTSCTGIVARLEAAAEATLYAELCAADADGMPVTATPLARGEVTMAATAPGAAPRWTAIAFATPAALAPGTLAWAVLRGVRGAASLALERAAPMANAPAGAPARVNRGGLVWRALDEARATLGAQVRLLHRPEASSPIAALELRVEAADGSAAGTATRADPSATAVTVDVAARGGAGAARLVVTSRARGQVRLDGVLQRYGLPDGRLRVALPPRVAEIMATRAVDRIVPQAGTAGRTNVNRIRATIA